MNSQASVVFVSLPPSIGGSVRSLGAHVRVIDSLHRILAAPLGTTAADYLMSTGHFDEQVDVGVSGRVQIGRVPLGRFRLGRSVRAALAFRKWARQRSDSIDAIHANGMPEMAVAWPAAAALGIPLVVWAHGVDVPRYVERLAPLWRRRNVNIRWAAVSHAAADKILATGVATPDRMTVVPNPIDPAAILADSNGHTAEPTTLAYLGGTSTRKGFDMLPGLMADLDDLPVRLLTAGSCPKEDDPNWIALEVHADRVLNMGGLDDVRDIYGPADIVLMPSRQESFGRVAAEAMMNGLPVVAFDIPAVREVVGHREAGLLVPVDDQSALNHAVRTLIAEPDLRRELSRTGRARSEAFMPAAVSRALCNLYGVEFSTSG